jgi:Lsr2
VAQKVQIILVDDLDGGPATETVAFALDGTGYEIDLSATNAAALREAFARYVGSARKVGSRGRGRASGRRPSGADSRTADIRAWARGRNLKVSDRGRIPADVVASYDAAHAR